MSREEAIKEIDELIEKLSGPYGEEPECDELRSIKNKLLESEPEPTIGSDSLREIAEQTWPVSNAAKRHLMHMADEFDSLIAELKAKDEEIQDLAGRMIFKGNSVSYIYQKMSSYRNHIGVAGNILRKHGLIEEFEQALKGEK